MASGFAGVAKTILFAANVATELPALMPVVVEAGFVDGSGKGVTLIRIDGRKLHVMVRALWRR